MLLINFRCSASGKILKWGDEFQCQQGRTRPWREEVVIAGESGREEGELGGDDCTSGLGLALLGHFALLPFLARRLSLLAGLCSNYTFLWRLASSAQS